MTSGYNMIAFAKCSKDVQSKIKDSSKSEQDLLALAADFVEHAKTEM